MKTKHNKVSNITTEKNNSSIEVSPIECKNSVWKWVFLALAGLGLISIIGMSTGAGMSGDEHFHAEHAVNVYNYYITGGADSTAAVVTPEYNLPYYGQSVDNLAYVVAKIFGIEVKGAFHAVFVEKLNKTSVLRTAVIIAERERIALTVLESVE